MEILLNAICYILGYIVGGVIFLAWVYHDEYKEIEKYEERFFSEREEQIEQAKKYFLSRAVNKEE